MSTLLVLRERLKRLYAGYSVYIMKVLQFIMGLLLFWLINSNIGFMKMASSVICTVGLAVICTFLPVIVMVLAATVLILAHFYALSLPIAAVSLVIFLMMYIFYFRFTPKKAWLVLVAALAFGLKIPFVVPVAFGLMGTPVWIVPAACGAISYYMVHFVKVSATALKSADADSMVAGLMSFTKQVLENREMWLMVMTAALGILVVNAVRSRAAAHIWKTASGAGVAVCVIFTAAGNIFLDLHFSYAVMAVSAAAGVFVGVVLEFLFFSVDYSRTEHIQFEDDEYYYYVKAVPKVGVPVPEKRVKHITEHQPQGMEDNGNAAKERSTDEILLTRSLSKELGLDKSMEEK